MKKNIYLIMLTSIFIAILARAQFAQVPDPIRPATSASDTAGVASGILVQPTVIPSDTINNFFPDNNLLNKAVNRRPLTQQELMNQGLLPNQNVGTPGGQR